ncbi:hypothetical protein [Desulfoscipio gibsoniae]|nr:hypothetical protein [Desulfoscipio gibsoniae]
MEAYARDELKGVFLWEHSLGMVKAAEGAAAAYPQIGLLIIEELCCRCP